MNKQKLKILEKAFVAEVNSALDKNMLGIIQTRSKAAKELENDGYIQEVVFKDGNFTVKGYALTLKGHIEYCYSC